MGGRSTGLVPAALLLASLTGTLAFSKNFVNSSLPDSKFTFVVNFDFSQVICQHSENKSDLHVHEMSILCDGKQDCFSNPAMHDESFPYCEKKCTSTCNNRGACLYDGHRPQCYCNSGFSGPSCEFIDKNECLDRPCHLMADCLNTPVGFSCVCRPGFHGDGYDCADIDECSTPNLCPEHSNCVNLPGTHYCNCTEGFTQKGDTLVTKCLDINECEQGSHDCGKNHLCENTIGGFTCVSGCTEGYELLNGECFDIDECKNDEVCDPRAECFNSPGSYSCVCEDGMTGDGKHCEPVTDCTQREDICDRHAQCIYPFKMCQCVAGFVGDGITCHDIDECEASEEPCKNQKGKRCVNIVGGHICCEEGSDDARCIEEQGVFCAGGCGLNAFCGNKTCECLPGYSGDPQKKCLDVNECDADNLCPGVGQWCVNVFGSYLCCGPQSTEPECQGVHIFRNSDGTTSVLHSNHSREVVVSAEQGEHSVSQQGGFIAVGRGVIRANGTLPSISVLSRRACTSYCPINSECVAGYCECSKGFGGNPHLGCEDINECELNAPCGEQTDDNWCVNTEGSFTCCTRESPQDECIGLEIISGPGGGLRLVGGQKDDKIYHASVNETSKHEEFSAKVHQYQNTSEGGAILIVKQTVPTDVTILKPEEGEMGLEITGDGIRKEKTQPPQATVTLPGIISTIGGLSSTTTAIPVTEIPIHVPDVSQESTNDKKNETNGTTTVLILSSTVVPKPEVEGSGLGSPEDEDMLKSERTTTQASSTLSGNINVRFTTLDELRGNVNATRTTVKEDKEVTKGPKTVIDGDGHGQEETVDGKAGKGPKTTIDGDETGDVSVIDRVVGTTAQPTEEEPDPDKEGLEIVHRQTKPVTDVSTAKPSEASSTEQPGTLATATKSTTDNATGTVGSDKPDLVEDKGEKSGHEHDDKTPGSGEVKTAITDKKETGSSGSTSSSSSGTAVVTKGNGAGKGTVSPDDGNGQPKSPETEENERATTSEGEKTTTESTTGETGLEIKWEGTTAQLTSEATSTKQPSSEATASSPSPSTEAATEPGTDETSTISSSSISTTQGTTGEAILETTTGGKQEKGPDTDIHHGENPETTQGEDGKPGGKTIPPPQTEGAKSTTEPTTAETGLEIVYKGTTTPSTGSASTVDTSSTPVEPVTEAETVKATTGNPSAPTETLETTGTTREGHVNVSIGPTGAPTTETTPEAGLEIIHESTTGSGSTTAEAEGATTATSGETTVETTAEPSSTISQGVSTPSEGRTDTTASSGSTTTPEEGLEIVGKPEQPTEKPTDTGTTSEKEVTQESTIGTTPETIETPATATGTPSTEQPDLVLTVNTTGSISPEKTTQSSTAETVTTATEAGSSTIGASETSSSAATTTPTVTKEPKLETTAAGNTTTETITTTVSTSTTERPKVTTEMASSVTGGSSTTEEVSASEATTASAEATSSGKTPSEIVPEGTTSSLESTTPEQPDLVLTAEPTSGSSLIPSSSSTSATGTTAAVAEESTTVTSPTTEKATSSSPVESTKTPSTSAPAVKEGSTFETFTVSPSSPSSPTASASPSTITATSSPTEDTSESTTDSTTSSELSTSPTDESTTQQPAVKTSSISSESTQKAETSTTTSGPTKSASSATSTAASTPTPTAVTSSPADSTSTREASSETSATTSSQGEITSTPAVSSESTGATTPIALETAPGEIAKATKTPETDVETVTPNPDEDLTAAPSKQQRLPPTDVPAEPQSSTSTPRLLEEGTTKDIYSLPEKPTPSPVTLGPNNVTKCVSSDECGDDALCERRTGACRCLPGFEGTPPSTPCSDVDECAEGLHKCHESARCHNIVGTYACFCPMGYRKNESGACIDIDECSESRGNCCSLNGTCVNKEGSYGCECKPGFFGDGYKCMPVEKRVCTEAELAKAGCGQHHVCMVDGLGAADCNTCKMGFKMANGNCTDVNECAEPSLNMCSQSADCNNLLGTYACSCKQGFKGDGYMCEDIDECNGNPCHPQAECENLLGSFKCTCPSGFTGDGIKECQNPFEKSCENVKEFCGRVDHVACLSVRIFNGSLSSVCECEPGFRFNKEKNACEDINECDENRHNCDPASSTCVNEEGGFHCECAEGYEGVGGVCVDVNECERGTAGCHSMAMCLNQPGSCGCKCMHGFTGDGIQCNPLQKREEDNACTAEWDRLCLLENKTCHVDEEDVPQCGSCIEGHHPINGSCQPVHGAGTCADPKKNTCDKNAECIDIPGTPGKHFCTCKKGFIGDGLRCDDIDECSLTGICHLHATCQNIPGSFNCICNTGYTGNGFTCTKESGPNCHLNGELCHKDAECTMDGQCKCKDGFEGDGFKECTEVGSAPTTTTADIDTTTGKQATVTPKATESTIKETTTTESLILTGDKRSSTRSTSTSTRPMISGTITEIEGPESVEMIPGSARVNLTGVTTTAPTTPATASITPKISVGPEPPSTIPTPLAKTTHQSGTTTPAPVTSTVIHNETESNASSTVTSRVTEDELTSAIITTDAADPTKKTTLTGFDPIDQRKTTPTTIQQLPENTTTPSTDASTAEPAESMTSVSTTDVVQVSTKLNSIEQTTASATESSSSPDSTKAGPGTTKESATVNSSPSPEEPTVTIPEAEETEIKEVETTTRALIPEGEETESTTPANATEATLPEAEEPDSTTTGEIITSTETGKTTSPPEEITTGAVSSSTGATNSSTIPEGEKDTVATNTVLSTKESTTTASAELSTPKVTVVDSSSTTSLLSTEVSTTTSSSTPASSSPTTQHILTEESTTKSSSTESAENKSTTETLVMSVETTEQATVTSTESASNTTIRESTTDITGSPTSKEMEVTVTPSSEEISTKITKGPVDSTTMEIIWSEEMTTNQLEGDNRAPQETTKEPEESTLRETTGTSSILPSTEIVSTSPASKDGEGETPDIETTTHTTRIIVEIASETSTPKSPETTELTSSTAGTTEPRESPSHTTTATPIQPEETAATVSTTRESVASRSTREQQPTVTEATSTVETSSIAPDSTTNEPQSTTSEEITLPPSEEPIINSSEIPVTTTSSSTTGPTSSTAQVSMVTSLAAVSTTEEIVPTAESSASTADESTGTSPLSSTAIPATVPSVSTTSRGMNATEPVDLITENSPVPPTEDSINSSKKPASSTTVSAETPTSGTEKPHRKGELSPDEPIPSSLGPVSSTTEKTLTSSTTADPSVINPTSSTTGEPAIQSTEKQTNESELVSSTPETTSRPTSDATSTTSETSEPTTEVLSSTTEKVSNSTEAESPKASSTTDEPTATISGKPVTSPLTEFTVSTKSPTTSSPENSSTESTTGATTERSHESPSLTTNEPSTPGAATSTATIELSSTTITSDSTKSSTYGTIPSTTSEPVTNPKITSRVTKEDIGPIPVSSTQSASTILSKTTAPSSSSAESGSSSSTSVPTSRAESVSPLAASTTVEPVATETSSSTTHSTEEPSVTTLSTIFETSSPVTKSVSNKSLTEKEVKTSSTHGITSSRLPTKEETSSLPADSPSSPSSLLTVVLSSTTATLPESTQRPSSSLSTSLPLSSTATLENSPTLGSSTSTSRANPTTTSTTAAENNPSERSTTVKITPSTSGLFKEVTESVSSTVTTVSTTQSTDQPSPTRDSTTVSVSSVHSTQLFTSNGNTAHPVSSFPNSSDTSSAAPPSMTPPNFETTELAPTTEAEVYGSTTPEEPSTTAAVTSTESTSTGENSTTRHPAQSISEQTEAPSTYTFMHTTREPSEIASNTVSKGDKTELEGIETTTTSFPTANPEKITPSFNVSTSAEKRTTGLGTVVFDEETARERGITAFDEKLASVTVTQPNVLEDGQMATSTRRPESVASDETQPEFGNTGTGNTRTVSPTTENPSEIMSTIWMLSGISTNTEQSTAIPLLRVETTKPPDEHSSVGTLTNQRKTKEILMDTATNRQMASTDKDTRASIGKEVVGSFLSTTKMKLEITETWNTEEPLSGFDASTTKGSSISSTEAAPPLDTGLETIVPDRTHDPITDSGSGVWTTETADSTETSATPFALEKILVTAEPPNGSSTKEFKPVTSSSGSVTQTKLASATGKTADISTSRPTTAIPSITTNSTVILDKEEPPLMQSLVQQTTNAEMRAVLTTESTTNPEEPSRVAETSVVLETVTVPDSTSVFSESSSTTLGIMDPSARPQTSAVTVEPLDSVQTERVTPAAGELARSSMETSSSTNTEEPFVSPSETSAQPRLPTTRKPLDHGKPISTATAETSTSSRNETLGSTLVIGETFTSSTETSNSAETTPSSNMTEYLISEESSSSSTRISTNPTTEEPVESGESNSPTPSPFKSVTLETVLGSSTGAPTTTMSGNLIDLSGANSVTRQPNTTTSEQLTSMTTDATDTTTTDKPSSVTNGPSVTASTSEGVTSSTGTEVAISASTVPWLSSKWSTPEQNSTSSTKNRDRTTTIETATPVTSTMPVPHDAGVTENLIQSGIKWRTTGQTETTTVQNGRGVSSSETPTTTDAVDKSTQERWRTKGTTARSIEYSSRGPSSVRPESYKANKRTTALFPTEDFEYTRTKVMPTMPTTSALENTRFSLKYSTTPPVSTSTSSHALSSTITEKTPVNGQNVPETVTDDGVEVRTEPIGHTAEIPQREGQRGICTADDRSRCHEFAICDLSTSSCRCKDGFEGDGYTSCQYKITINCVANSSLCHPDAFCDRHVQKCACNAGYIGDGILCSPDPQDCILRKDLCSPDATCSGRRCHCIEGFTGDGVKCVSLHQRSANCSECDINAHCDQGVCTCNIGYFGNGLCCVPDPRDCVHFPGICHPEAICDAQNRQCTCSKGYLGDGISCFPAVSCVTDSSVCHKNAICLPSGHCMCRNGFEGNGHSCQQISALGLRIEGHDVPSLCGNKCNRESELCIDGECICKHGFKKINGVCEDVDECLKSPCHPLASCQNSRGSYSCACPEGYVGDGKTCVQHLKIGELGVFCENDGMTLVLSNETQMFEGKMYVRGQAENPHCIKTFSPLQQHARPYTFKVFFEHCNVQLLENNTFAATVIVQKHPHFITTSADSYELKCTYSPDVTKVQSHVNVSELAPTSTLSNQFDGPTCSLKITDDHNDFVESAKVGQSMVLRLEVAPNGTYGILPRDCVAVNIETGERYHLTDRHGCAVDDQLFPEFTQLHPWATEAVFRTFKWPDSSMIRFQCDCKACVGPCPTPDCNRLQKKSLPRFRRAHRGENDEMEVDNQLETENVVDTKRKAFSRLLAVHEDVEEQIAQEEVQHWSRSALSESVASEGVCVRAAVLAGASLLLILSLGFLTSVVLHQRRSTPPKSPDRPISVISL